MKVATPSLVTAAFLLVPAIVVFADAPSPHPYPGGAEADIWVLAGQSNMQGYGLLTAEHPANPKIMMFGLNNEWMPAVPPTHRVYTAAAPVFKNLIFAKNPGLTEEAWERMAEGERKKPANITGPERSFAECIAGVTGHNIGLLPCALGSTSMADWNPASRDQGDRSLYGNMIERIRMVGGRIKGVLWYQGESDAGNAATIDAYPSAFLDLVDGIRRDTGIPDLPFIYVQISRFCLENQDSAASWDTIREKQRTLAARRKNLWVVPAIDLPLDDLIHLGAPGQARLGKRLAQVALTYVYDVKGCGRPIDFLSCEILPPLDTLHNRMRVKFSGVTGWLQSQGRPAGFELRSDDPKKDGPMVYKVEFDPGDPSAVTVWYSKAITNPVRLYYGAGLNPYVNITDSLDMAIPALGPITVAPSS
jgi:sialate O-acetylesterase